MPLDRECRDKIIDQLKYNTTAFVDGTISAPQELSIKEYINSLFDGIKDDINNWDDTIKYCGE